MEPGQVDDGNKDAVERVRCKGQASKGGGRVRFECGVDVEAAEERLTALCPDVRATRLIGGRAMRGVCE